MNSHSRSQVIRPWGKLQQDKVSGIITDWQSLADHSRDVAQVFRALVALPGIRSRLEYAAGAPLTDVHLDRMAYLVFLHDMGKVNNGFQDQMYPGRRKVGHIAPLNAIFAPDSLGQSIADKGMSILDPERLMTWGDTEMVNGLLHVVFSHHGTPWPCGKGKAEYRGYWQEIQDYSCWDALRDLVNKGNELFPGVDESTSALPLENRLLHSIAGLIQLADWLGSAAWDELRNTERLPGWESRILSRIGMDPAPWRNSIKQVTFEQAFGYTPFPHQAASGESDDRLVILESETGSGKTEAALWRFLQLFAAGKVDGLYFALPTRTAAAQLHRRVERFANAVWDANAPEVILAVPGYLSHEADSGLPDATDAMDGPENDTRSFTGWANAHPKRYFSGLLGVGTVDQALLSSLLVKHAHLRGSMLMRQFLVVDEVHASDDYMRAVLEQLLLDHIAAGGYAMLLSATLTATARESFLSTAINKAGRPERTAEPEIEIAEQTPYPLLSAATHGSTNSAFSSATRKDVAIECLPIIDDSQEIARQALLAASSGAKVLVVRNTVRGATDVFSALLALGGDAERFLLKVNGLPALHHGRFAVQDRRLLDAAIESAMGRVRPAGGCIAVGTQTLEQSLDLDADLLITDLCPADVLLQRIGRLHRHVLESDDRPRKRPEPFRVPQVRLLVPDGGLEPYLSKIGRSRNRHGFGFTDYHGHMTGTYMNLVQLEATWRLAESIREWRIPDMNRIIVERTLHPVNIRALQAELTATSQGDWEAHLRRLEGEYIARRVNGRMSVLVRSEDFMEQTMDADQRITTRIGADNLLQKLPTGTNGAFGETVSSISIPAWMLVAADTDVPAEITGSPDRSGFEIEFQGISSKQPVQLLYDRLGLRNPPSAQTVT